MTEKSWSLTSAWARQHPRLQRSIVLWHYRHPAGMACGIIRRLKRMYAPKHWMLDKIRRRWALKPCAGSHKLQECIPSFVMWRERLRCALTYREVKMIVMQRLIEVDSKVRSDMFFPAGSMDAVQIENTNRTSTCSTFLRVASCCTQLGRKKPATGCGVS